MFFEFVGLCLCLCFEDLVFEVVVVVVVFIDLSDLEGVIVFVILFSLCFVL